MEKVGITKKVVLSVVLLFAVLLCGGKVSDAAPVSQYNEYTRTGVDNVALQDQMARFEAERFSQIKNALLTDFWTQYRLYIQALATGTAPDPAVTNALYPKWPLSSTPNNGQANFQYLADKYLPDLKSQLESLSRTTGIPVTDYYEIEYVAPVAGEPLPAPGHVVIHRKHAEVSTQGRIRALLGSVSIDGGIGENGVISMKVDPPSAFMGSDALNVSLVRNNGLTLDPDIAKALNSETGGPDITFVPGSWVTFAKKGTNAGTAQAKGESDATVFTPTLNFKGKDGQIIGVNLQEMNSGIGDPVARLLFKNAAGSLPDGAMSANYIRFEDNKGQIMGLQNIYRRDAANGMDGNNLALAIWADASIGGNLTLLKNGESINGTTATKEGKINFGLGGTASIYLNGDGNLRIVANNNITLKAPKIVLDGEVDLNNVSNLHVTGTSALDGAVAMKNGLNMSNTNITNVGNLTANSATLNSMTLGGRTGASSAQAYNVWVTNSNNSSLLGGKSEENLRVAYADKAGTSEFANQPGPDFKFPIQTPDLSNVDAVKFEHWTADQWKEWVLEQIGSKDVGGGDSDQCNMSYGHDCEPYCRCTPICYARINGGCVRDTDVK